MTMFGINIQIDERDLKPENLQESLVAEFVRKNDERKIFTQFLSPIFDEISKKAKEEADLEVKNGKIITPSALEDYIKEKLTRTKNGNSNLYDSLINKIILEFDPHVLTTDPLKNPSYPGLHKKATGLIKAKIKDSINDNVKIEYLTDQKTREVVKNLSKEMFFALNKLGLSDEKLISYLRITYQLDRLSVCPMESRNIFKNYLGKALREKLPINLTNLKCFRRVYPCGNRLQVLEDSKPASITTLDGNTYEMRGELSFLQRINDINRIFASEGLSTNCQVLLMDTDFEDLFAEGTDGLFPESDLEKTQGSMQNYFQSLLQSYPTGIRINLLSEEIKRRGCFKEFTNIRERVVRDLRQEVTALPQSFIEERVNYRYETDIKIFGKSNRRSCRTKTYNQIATQYALEVLCGENVLFILEDRGIENKLIGGPNNNQPVVFVSLHDE